MTRFKKNDKVVCTIALHGGTIKPGSCGVVQSNNSRVYGYSVLFGSTVAQAHDGDLAFAPFTAKNYNIPVVGDKVRILADFEYDMIEGFIVRKDWEGEVTSVAGLYACTARFDGLTDFPGALHVGMNNKRFEILQKGSE